MAAKKTGAKTQAQGNGAKIAAVLDGRADYADLWETTPIGTASGLLHSERVLARIRYSETGWGEIKVIHPVSGDTFGYVRYEPSTQDRERPYIACWDFDGELPLEFLGRFRTVMDAIRWIMR
jgi:hypothetical protein